MSCDKCGSDKNELDELIKAEKELERLQYMFRLLKTQVEILKNVGNSQYPLHHLTKHINNINL